MMELTIKDEIYQFNYGMGFLRDVNKLISIDVDIHGNKQNVGLMYYVGLLIDRNVEALSKVLELANKGQNPRLTQKIIDEYIDNECENMEGLFETVLDFLEKSNACGLTVAPMRNKAKDSKLQ